MVRIIFATPYDVGTGKFADVGHPLGQRRARIILEEQLKEFQLVPSELSDFEPVISRSAPK